MSCPEEMKKEGLEVDFKKRFLGSCFRNILGDYIYSINNYSEDDKNNDFSSRQFLLKPLNSENVKKLMEQSLKEDKDLLFEACKDRPYDEIKEYEKLGIKI